jgi:hypothetical protein
MNFEIELERTSRIVFGATQVVKNLLKKKAERDVAMEEVNASICFLAAEQRITFLQAGVAIDQVLGVMLFLTASNMEKSFLSSLKKTIELFIN